MTNFSFKILAVQNVIALNSLLFVEKIRNFPQILPKSMLRLISHDAPTNTSTLESSSNWLENYGTTIYRHSVFFKGPLLSVREEYKDLSTNIHKSSLKSFKKESRVNFLKLNQVGMKLSGFLKISQSIICQV